MGLVRDSDSLGPERITRFCLNKMTKSKPVTTVQKSGIAVGVNAGHVVTPRTLKPKPVSRKGVGI
jgi:hypothetical protein